MSLGRPLLLSSLVLSLISLPACTDDDGGSDGAGCTRTVSENITAATQWAPGADNCDYLVTKDTLSVSAALTLAPGTVVRFASNTGIVVEEEGSLNAVGTAEAPIRFTGKTQTPGFWKGIAFRSNNPANVLEYAVLSYAGNEDPFCCDYFYGLAGSQDARAAVILGNNRDLSVLVRIDHTTIEHSGTEGLFAFNKAKLTGFSQNLFRGNRGAPVTLNFYNVGSLDSATIYSGQSAEAPEANGLNFIRLLDAPDADSAAAQTIHKLDVPYAVSEGQPGEVIVYGGALALEAGVRFEFEANSGLMVEESGSINAVGTAADPIVFTGKTATAGFWRGLAISSNSTSNVLNYVQLSYGGGETFCCSYWTGSPVATDVNANLVVGRSTQEPAKLVLSNSTLSHSGKYGLASFIGATVTETANTFSDNPTDRGTGL